jgi:hypothetical protein
MDLMLRSTARDAKFVTKIDSLGSSLSTEIKELDSRLTSRIDALSVKVDSATVAVTRLEGAVWGRVPVEPTQGRA